MKNELLFYLPDSRTLLIRSDALKKMYKYRQLQPRSTEAGGILIGRILIENENLIIDDVSEPMPNDIRKRQRFIRSPIGHQQYFNEIWNRNCGHCFYLGEWHTHPELVPTPSFVDKRDWKQNLNREYESDVLFFIIVGTKEIRVWHGCRKSGEIIALIRDTNE
jgi:integrative and conjugative element protein (TIGR02256 family)